MKTLDIFIAHRQTHNRNSGGYFFIHDMKGEKALIIHIWKLEKEVTVKWTLYKSYLDTKKFIYSIIHYIEDWYDFFIAFLAFQIRTCYFEKAHDYYITKFSLCENFKGIFPFFYNFSGYILYTEVLSTVCIFFRYFSWCFQYVCMKDTNMY
jgi:hypothetical protein